MPKGQRKEFRPGTSGSLDPLVLAVFLFPGVPPAAPDGGGKAE